ncbi:ATP-binding cassette domain-containing protein [Mucilaginibacter auburnensis]|uniref:Molybdate transport system ATP-binding protein n=1 Tax=Mucilaginibacter auburnensis TaxID=1457233 RepID=A0A2H9VS61_9SPHI|nr:ATP-binding cassette domain-containing protein [Mucilaginibacter auburnensis]PJJ83654.1 molybdate transport system ATP-binding protein [Mucilaginibacter auburnensis]
MISVAIEKKLKGYAGAGTLKVQHQFATGSVTAIHGPSGAGKTTFLKIVAGLTSPENGLITVNEQVWLDTARKVNLSPQQRRLGFVFQDYALFPNMSVTEHMQYATNDKDWIDYLLKAGKLETLTKHQPAYLSGGQQQRLAILRALAIKPQIILMDEPFSALDKLTKNELIIELSAVFKTLKSTVLVVTHNPDELSRIADEELYISAI